MVSEGEVMQVQITVDDELVAQTMKAAGLPSQEATVEAALRRLLRQSQQRQAVEELRGLGWEGDLDAMREGRSGSNR